MKGDDKADLDLGLDIVDGVAALDLKGDGLPRQGLHEDLHLDLTGPPPKLPGPSFSAAAARLLRAQRGRVRKAGRRPPAFIPRQEG